MRSVAEIQADIDKVSVELAQAQRELEEYEAKATDEKKAQDTDPEWHIARRNYIDTGDMSGVTNWYNRRDQQRRDKANDAFRDRELKISEKEKSGEVSADSKEGKRLIGAYLIAKRGLANANKRFANGDDNVSKSHLFAAEQELERTKIELANAGLGGIIAEDDGEEKNNTPVDKYANAPYAANLNGLRALSGKWQDKLAASNATRAKSYYEDAEFDADEAYLKAVRDDEKLDKAVRDEAKKMLEDMGKDDKKSWGRYYRRSDREARDAQAKNKNAKIKNLNEQKKALEDKVMKTKADRERLAAIEAELKKLGASK